MKNSRAHSRGFTLIEIAIGLLIMGLILGGGLSVLSSQIEQQKIKDTQKILEESKEALIGFALSNGRLPCPASGASAGLESFCTNALPAACGVALISPPAAVPAHGRCTNPYNGFLPAVSLGLATQGGGGFALDAFSTPLGRIRYAVTTSNASAFTAPTGMRTATMGVLVPDLRVCASATGITATICGAAPANSLTNNAAAVIYSLGDHPQTGGAGVDESANPNPNSANNDQVFVSHPPVGPTGVNGAFNDIVIWLSPNILFNRMVQAGQLP